jgi:hypothetical protein
MLIGLACVLGVCLAWAVIEVVSDRRRFRQREEPPRQPAEIARINASAAPGPESIEPPALMLPRSQRAAG